MTNEIKSSNMGGAIIGLVGAGGSLPTEWSYISLDSVEVLSVGVEDGLPCLELRAIYDNTSNGSAKSVSIRAPSVTVNSGETWTASTYYKLVSGSFVNDDIQTQVKIAGGDGVDYEANNQVYIDGTRQRISQTEVIAKTDPAYIEYRMFNCSVPAGQTLDVTFKLYAPQLEVGNYANAPVITGEGITGYSQAIKVWHNISSYDLSNGSVVGEIDLKDLTLAGWSRFIEVGKGYSNRINIERENDGSGFKFSCRVGGVAVTSTTIAIPLGRVKYCITWSDTEAKLFLNGLLIRTLTLADPYGASDFSQISLSGENGTTRSTIHNYLKIDVFDIAIPDAQAILETTL